MAQDSEPVERAHNEAPAEGDPSADPVGPRFHTQDPAEGPDTDDTAAGQGKPVGS
jgi:hypothetical protein